MYLNNLPYAPTASFNVVRKLVEAAESQGLEHHVGLINTEDAFYATLPEHVQRYEDIGVLSVEMEAAALFLIGKLRKVETGCILVASNYIGDPQLVEASIMKRGIDNMAKVALGAGIQLSR